MFIWVHMNPLALPHMSPKSPWSFSCKHIHSAWETPKMTKWALLFQIPITKNCFQEMLMGIS